MSDKTRPQLRSRVKLLGRLHARARAAGLNDEDRYALQERVTGVRSSSRMTVKQLRDVCAAIEGGETASLPQGQWSDKLRALWISGYHLGVVRSGTVAALATWIQREAGVEAAEWAPNPGALVESLKLWLARPVAKGGGGVNWRDSDDPRVCVVAAQARILGRVDVEEMLAELGHRDRARDQTLDGWIRALGKIIRKQAT